MPLPQFLLLTLALVPLACGSSTSQTPATGSGNAASAKIAFDEERAWKDLEYLVNTIGRRRIGTSELQLSREYIRKQLEPLGWVFEEDNFECKPPEGARRKGTITGTNLLARWPGSAKGEVWLASHYDTFDRPKFIGANDGGSSTAVLIEIGRQLARADKKAVEGPAITLVWFDGEEPFYPVPWDDYTNSTFGSRHLAKKLDESGKILDIQALILMDLVGDKQLGLEIEKLSTDWLGGVIRDTARKLNYEKHIVGNKEIKDDHRPFLALDVPSIDLIDFKYPNSFNEYWHTADDQLEHCSAKSLGVTGRLVLGALPAVIAEAAKQDPKYRRQVWERRRQEKED